MLTCNTFRGWLAVVPILLLAVAGGHAQTGTHVSSYFYDPPGTVTVTNSFSYPEGTTLGGLYWWPVAPVGVTVGNVRGDAAPYLDGWGGIGFTAYSFPNPVVFYYDLTIPSGMKGDIEVQGYIYYTLMGGGETEIMASPNPLILRQPRSISGFIFHETDNNGIYNTTDQPVSDITVMLREGGTTNRVADPVVTGADGYYSFGRLPDGDFDVIYWVKTNQVTIAPGGSDTNRNQLVPNSDRIISVSITSATDYFINVGLIGESPLSSAIDLRAYQGSDGVYVEFVAYDVEEDGAITLYLLDEDGGILWSGTIDVRAGPRHVCRFKVPGLTVGSTYSFMVRDEVGKIWQAAGVTVGEFAAEMIRMSLAGIDLQFNSLPEREYSIQWTSRLGTGWRTVTNVTSIGDRTRIFVVHPDPEATSGFFRILLK